MLGKSELRSLPFVPDNCPLRMAEEVYEVKRVDGRQRQAEDELRDPICPWFDRISVPNRITRIPLPILAPITTDKSMMPAAVSPAASGRP
jgi:hypothetical protein